MMSKDEKTKKALRAKIESKDDFIYCPRLGNSLQNLLDVYPNGVSDDRISKVLLLNPEEVDTIFQSALKKLRKALKLNIKED